MLKTVHTTVQKCYIQIQNSLKRTERHFFPFDMELIKTKTSLKILTSNAHFTFLYKIIFIYLLFFVSLQISGEPYHSFKLNKSKMPTLSFPGKTTFLP